jgi:hypothetical protein
MPKPRDKNDSPRARDLALLGGSLALLALSTILAVQADSSVRFPGVGNLPTFCLFRLFTGRQCPGCGMTRAFVALGHLDVTAAWSYHRISPLLYALVMVQIPYRTLRLLWDRFRRFSDVLEPRLHLTIILGLAALMIANWALRLASI